MKDYKYFTSHYCFYCEQYNICKYPCGDVESFLKAQGIHKKGFLHPKEETPDADIDNTAIRRAFYLRWGTNWAEKF